MKILMVIDSLVKGGKERRMLELIKALKKHKGDFDIYLVSLTESVEYNYVYDLPIKFEILKRKYRKDFTIVFKLGRIIASFQPDIIHSWGTMSSIYLAGSNLFRNKPFINATVADAHPHLSISDKHYLRVKLTTPFSDVIVSNSEAGIKAYRTPLHKSVCIYNGIDFNRFENLRPAADVENELLGHPKNDCKIVAMIAAFQERKDYETLVNAAIKLCSARKELIFLLVGDGPTLPALKNKVPSELLDTQIIFTGRKDDIESIIQIIDIGMLITNADVHGEGISNSIIEYMALGKPVIATRGGGTDEVVKDGINGFLIDPKNEEQLMEKVELLLRNTELASELGKNAYNWARDQFDVDKKTEDYISLYHKLINAKRSNN